MRFKVSGLALALCLGVGGVASTMGGGVAWADSKNKKAATEAGGDKSIEKQSAWEQKVMGEDHTKSADAKKIAAAQKMAEEARKNPPPEPVKKYKDPNKEGVRAKSEASIGLPIESEEAQKTSAKRAVVAKKAEPSSSANDELGALVAASLASEKKSSAASEPAPTSSRGRKGKPAKAGKATASASSESSLDKMFGSK